MPATTRLRVRGTTRSRSTDLRRRADRSLAARVSAPPTDGSANRALIGLLAKILDLPRREFSIEGGNHTRSKRIAVTTDNPVGPQAAVNRLEASR